MIPPVIAGVGFLIGVAIKHWLDSEEKETLKADLLVAEETLAKAQDALRQSADREVKQRHETLRLTLEWTRTRLSELLTDESASLARLERVYSTGIALGKIIENLPKDAILSKQDSDFVGIIARGMNGERLGKSEASQIDDYLNSKVGVVRRDFLENRLSAQYKRLTKTRQRLQFENDELEQRLAVDEQRVRIGKVSIPDLDVKRSRLRANEEEIKRLGGSIDQIEMSLVVLTRVSRPEEAQGQDDDAARDIVGLLARGTRLTDEENAFLRHYQMKYFASAREILKRRRGIEIGFQGEAQA